MLPTMCFPRIASETLVFAQHKIQVYKRFQYKVRKKIIKGLANNLKICEKKLVWERNMRIAIAK